MACVSLVTCVAVLAAWVPSSRLCPPDPALAWVVGTHQQAWVVRADTLEWHALGAATDSLALPPSPAPVSLCLLQAQCPGSFTWEVASARGGGVHHRSTQGPGQAANSPTWVFLPAREPLVIRVSCPDAAGPVAVRWALHSDRGPQPVSPFARLDHEGTPWWALPRGGTGQWTGRWAVDLPPGHALMVRVPVRGASVRLEASGDHAWVPVSSTVSGDTLTAVWCPPPGRLTLSAHLDGQTPLVGCLETWVREAVPAPGEVRVTALAVAPSRDEMIEVTTLVPWDLSGAQASLWVCGRPISLKAHTLHPGATVLTREGGVGWGLPNARGWVKLSWEGTTLDSLAYGVGASLPAPPPGWCLRYDGQWRLLPLSGPHGVPSQARVCLGEVYLWPPGSGQRFVEVVNQETDPVDLGGWTVVCEAAMILPSPLPLGPGEALALGEDSMPQWFALNPDSGEVVLVEPGGSVVDRVQWHRPPSPGKALARAWDGTECRWEQAAPSPGVWGAPPASPTELSVTFTPEGRCIQWAYPCDSLSFVVSRALLTDPAHRSPVTAIPVRGPSPYVVLDAEAKPYLDYLYWLAVVWAGTEQVVAGPVVSYGVSLVSLGPANPNPFDEETWLPYAVDARGLGEVVGEVPPVQVAVYTMHGALVRLLAQECPRPGTQWVHWDGTDEAGRVCAPGVYVVSLHAGPLLRSTKVVFSPENGR